MNFVISMLRDVPDPRTGNATRHSLLDVLTIALVASICGCESCTEFADFAEDREDLFREFLDLSNGLPSHDTFSRLFRLLDPDALSRCFGRFLDHVGADGSGVLAVDGKTLRRSFDRAAGASPLHVVTAFAADARLVLGHRAMAKGENEIVAARALLGCLHLGGTLVTADAIHCQRDTAAVVLERGGDYLFSLKANRPAMLADVEAFFAAPATAGALAWHETVDADHGRVERRRHATTQDVAWLFSDRRYAGEPAMPGLTTLAVVDSTVERDGQTSRSRRYYLSSADLTPEHFAVAVRAHWSIENSQHWVLDTAFDEDRARNRKDNGPVNLAVLRRLALNVLRKARPAISIKRKRKRAGWSDAFARSILAQMR